MRKEFYFDLLKYKSILVDNKQIKNTLSILGFILVFVGCVFSAMELKKSNTSLEVDYLCSAAVLTLIFVVLSILRFQILCRTVNHNCSYGVAASVVIWGAVANLLPIPGSIAVRVTYLAQKIGVRKSSGVNILGVLVWLSIAFAITPIIWLIQQNESYAKTIAILAFVAGCFGCASIFLAFKLNLNFKNYFFLNILQLVISCIYVLRIDFLALSIDTDISLVLAAFLSLSGVISAAVGIVPAGIGLSELLSSLMASISGESTLVVGFTIAIIDRALYWLALSFATIVVRRDRLRF